MSETGNPYLGMHPRVPRKATSYIPLIIAVTGAAQPLTDQHIVGQVLNVYGYQGDDRTPNAGNVFIGWSASYQPSPVYPGLPSIVKADAGFVKDLSTLFIRGTAGDGVLVEYDNGFVNEL